MLRLLYVTDLHGWPGGYERTAAVAREEEISTIVNGGDMFPHGRDLIVTQRRFIVEYLRPYLAGLAAAGVSYYGMLGNDDCRSQHCAGLKNRDFGPWNLFGIWCSVPGI
ncbi:MAG: metallophosphoesterase [Planctomycetes bacterium]|jgi:hypothetical protein|nr:metallophosphoesterase [Planctomycetota bacterium]